MIGPSIAIILIIFEYCSCNQSTANCTEIKLDPSCKAPELFAYLTNPCWYDKQTAPLNGFNVRNPDRVHTRIHVYYFKQTQALNLQFRVHLLVQLRWFDPRLKFAHKTSHIREMTGESEFLQRIWTPHVYLASQRSPLIRGKLNKDVAVHILSDGTVLYTSRLLTDIDCWVKLGRFPLDKQKCNLNIDTWKFQSNHLLLKWENDTAVTISEDASILAEFQLIDTVFFTEYEFGEPDSISTHQYNCSSLRVIFYVARNYGYYIMNYYVPSVLMVGVSWVSFWEAPDAVPGRTLLGTGTMLTFIALGIEVSKSLPTVSYVRSNDLWFFGCTAFIFCSLAEFAFVNTLWRYGGQVELKKMTSKYILKSSLGVKQNVPRLGRRRSLSCPNSPTLKWENPFKRVVNNELTVKSLSDLEISLPLSELKNLRKETIDISSKSSTPEEVAPTMMSMREIAVWIDKKSRIVFPACFFIFNIVYWTLLFVA